MRFNSLNAREMAARSVAARRAAEAERSARAASISLQAIPPADTDPGISVACARARLETLDALMSRAKTDREWDNLTRAFDRLFRVWCTLTATPGPGNRKPPPVRPRAQAPLFLDPQPVPAGEREWSPMRDSPAAPSVEPVPIEVALRHRPARLSTNPASATPPSQKPAELRKASPPLTAEPD